MLLNFVYHFYGNSKATFVFHNILNYERSPSKEEVNSEKFDSEYPASQ